MIDKLIWLVFNTQLLVYVFCVIGALATLAWFWDNFSSLLSIIKTVLLPYFIPTEGYTLVEKFGNWAGRLKGKEKKEERFKLVNYGREKNDLLFMRRRIKIQFCPRQEKSKENRGIYVQSDENPDSTLI